MKLDQEKAPGNVIHGFSAGEIRIGDKIIRQHLILTIDRLITDWTPPAPADLTLQDLTPAIDLDPELIVLGTGQRQIFPRPEVAAAIFSRGIGLEIMDTGAACRTFNILASEYRRVAAVLFLT
jgi:uncharacterized protein